MSDMVDMRPILAPFSGSTRALGSLLTALMLVACAEDEPGTNFTVLHGGSGGSAGSSPHGGSGGAAGQAQAGQGTAGGAAGQGGSAQAGSGGSGAGGSAQAGKGGSSGGSSQAGSGGSSQAGSGGSGGSAQAGSGGSAQAGEGGSSGAGGEAQAGSGGSAQAGSGGSAQAGSGGSAQAGSGGSAGSGGGGAPADIPAIDSEPPQACPEAQSGDYFQFLDDVCKDKRYPSYVDRAQACPVVDPSATVQLVGGGTVTYAPASAPVEVDGEALKGIVPDDVLVTVILIKRVNGVPHYRYLSNGQHNVAYQPWSTTKFLAAANAASRLRVASDYKVGLTASVKGIPLGDLVTTMHRYDNNPYSSNAMGRYFHDVGGRQRANDLIHDLWLERPAGETFGGNYGEAAPPLGYTFTEDGGASITVDPDESSGPSNKLSGFTMAEATKRLVMHREDASTRLPGMQWVDLETLFYGAAKPEKYSTPWGGMSADTAIYLQAGHDIDYIEKRSQGRWRIFSKLGLGSDGTFLDVGYACFPYLGSAQQPVPGWGREFVIATRQQTGGSTWRQRDRLLAKAYRAIVARIVDGRL